MTEGSEEEPTAAPVRTLVVDDHRTFAEVLAMRLRVEPGIEIIDIAFSIGSALALANKTSPDLVLLDLTLGDESGLDLLERLNQLERRPVVMMVSGVEEIEAVVESIDAGAMAWVPKDSSVEDLLTAVNEALAGRLWLPGALLGPVVSHLLKLARHTEQPKTFIDQLSPRQLEVLRCLVAGMTRAEIAERLFVSPNTVRTHVQNLLREAGAHSTLAVVAMARDAGLAGIDDEPHGLPTQRRHVWPE